MKATAKVTPTPEPTSLLLLGSGLAGIAGWLKLRWVRIAYAHCGSIVHADAIKLGNLSVP